MLGGIRPGEGTGHTPSVSHPVVSDHITTIREFVENHGFKTARMGDGELSAIPMQTEPILEALAALERELTRLTSFRDEVARQVGLYEMGWNDEMGLTESEVIPFIAQALEDLTAKENEKAD